MLITFLEDLKESLFNHSNCSHPSLEVVVYLFLSLKGWQSSILWSELCRFHSLYHYCHSLSLIAICSHSLSLVLSLVVTLCHSLYHSLSLVVIRCHSLSFVVTRCNTRFHSLSLVVTRCTTHLSFYKRSIFSLWIWCKHIFTITSLQHCPYVLHLIRARGVLVYSLPSACRLLFYKCCFDLQHL